MVIIALFVVYTLLLIWIGHRPPQNFAAFRDGAEKVSPRAVFFMVSALWSSSLIVVQIDTAYASGISALWYGVSVSVMSMMVSLLIPWFRRHQYHSNSALLGQVFGPRVKRFSGMVIGATFPVFALSNALAAGAFLHVVLGLALWLTMSMTTGVLILYIQFAGMMSLAATQGLNFAVVLMGLVFAVFKLGPMHVTTSPSLGPAFWNLGGIGHGLIWVWFGMNTLNVFAAQAEIQAVSAARDVRQAQKAVWWSTLLLLIIIAVSTWIGMKTRLLIHNPRIDGLVAFAKVMSINSPTWFIMLLGLGVWALALAWCGPLLFSGATSLGADVMAHIHRVRWTKVALIIEGILMVLYGIWRPQEVAWWRVFGLTLRNATVVGPTVAAFLWDDLPAGAVLFSMISGVCVGLGLNAWTGFSYTHFLGGVNPMWAAASTSFVVLASCRLGQYRQWWFLAWRLALEGGSATWAISAMARHDSGLLGVVVLLMGLALVAVSWMITPGPSADSSARCVS